MSVSFRGETICLEEGVDVGYEVEKIRLSSCGGGEFSAPTRGVTTLLLCAPVLDEKSLKELHELDSEFGSRGVLNFETVFVLSGSQTPPEGFGFIKFAMDDKDEFGLEFGVKIDSGALSGCLAKAVFAISRDHILYYKEICKDVEESFTMDRLYMQLGKALNVYTGTGCH
ncbi:MAG TPA: hypothetical protein PLV58_07810 [Campylobacterales bacterium]|nr:hypothetical protein [Campylobacterales bacterium]